MSANASATPRAPLVDENGETRELTQAVFDRGGLGAPWTQPPAQAARGPLTDAIALLERETGPKRAALEPTIAHLRAALRQLALIAES